MSSLCHEPPPIPLPCAAGTKALARLSHRTLWAAWSSWRAHVQRMRSLRLILRRIQLRCVLAALHSWREWASRMGRARAMMRRALMQAAAYYFAAWRAVAEVGGWVGWGMGG